MSSGSASEPPDGGGSEQQPEQTGPQPGQAGSSAYGYPPPEATQPQYGTPPYYGAPGPYGTPPPPGAPGPYGPPAPVDTPASYGPASPYGAPASYGAPSPYGAGPFGPGQPGPAYGAYPGAPPPTHLAWGIIAAVGGVLFCLIGGVPTAIAATTYARRVRQKWAMGDAQGAWRDSRTARNWAIAATVLDGIGLLIFVLVIALGTANQATTGGGP